MLVITTRQELEHQIFAAIKGVSTAEVVFADSIEAAHVVGHALVVLDLGSFTRGRVSDQIRQWRGQHPHVSWAYVLPLVSATDEIHLLNGLFPLGPARLITKPELSTRGIWLELASRKSVPTWRRLQDAVERGAHPHTIVHQVDVWPLLRQATDINSIKNYCTKLHVQPLTLWRRLTQAQQRPPKELLSAFRLLWCVALREDGLGTPEVCHYLHTSRDQLLRIGRPLGLTYRCVARIRTQDLVDVYVSRLLRVQTPLGLRPATLPPLLSLGALVKDFGGL